MENTVLENRKASEDTLTVLDSLLKDSGQRKLNENQLLIILDALASSDDAAIVARFPVVLAICARKGLELNSQALFSRYWETSPKRQNLEKLLLVSSELFKNLGLNPPENLQKIAASLKFKYAGILSAGEFQLSNGMCISIEELHHTLRYFNSSQVVAPLTNERPANRFRPGDLNRYLDRLFSPKQKELVFKKRDGKSFTKTEREYYSRTVRKKLEAIADDEVGELAKKLLYE
jgi:hypothetical protein